MDTLASRKLEFGEIVGKSFPKSVSKISPKTFPSTICHLKDHKLNPSGKTGTKENSKL